jgi:hypothetical protein
MQIRNLLVGLALLCTYTLQAQTLTLSGTLTDRQNGAPLSGATVRLRSTTDSTLNRSQLSDSLGRYAFSQLSPDSFVLTISFVGLAPLTRGVRLDSTNVTADIALAASSASELATVIIRSSPAPVTQRGDTLQVSADQFKVNPDASGEDLIRKVPGVTIENGQVKAQGENVQRVTIDGRELFGDDATAALRNLPAEVIDKIQIFDRLSDQAQFTGFDDGNTTKSINIVTRANMRNGQFGRVFAGYGTDQRYSAGGNATIFKNDRRISIVGNFNNINQQNFSQQDLLGVTSNAQRGGGGGGPRGGGGGPRGGSGNRGNAGAGGNQGGGNFGGFGNAGNFLVGQQNGINRTNAAGINFSDIWGKNLTVTGSYFFNNTRNTTDELARTQYFASNIQSSFDTTTSTSNNTNHRVNMRIEWRIDSNNQLIITPNLSFQDNESQRRTGRLFTYVPGSGLQQLINQNLTNSTRSGNNLNNTILYRHSFPKRGRTLSVNLNTSYNRREGESYVTTFQRQVFDASSFDSASQRLTDQFNNGLQLSSNLVYTEPIGTNSQLQFNYNPTYSRSTSDQQTFQYNNQQGKYSDFVQNLSNKFENRTTAHNAGLSYRYGNRDNQLSFGANYQNTSLNSERIFPTSFRVNKQFNNILPNAMVRLKLSTRSNVRLMYRTNVNLPSVTQLQDVVDIINAPIFTTGNPDLNTQFMHTVSTRYTYTNPTKGILFVGNVFWQRANNYISNATFTPILGDSAIGNNNILLRGEQLNKPVNLDGYSSLRSFFTFAVPLKFIKSNFNLNGGVSHSNLPGLINAQVNETQNTTYTIGTGISSNISQYVDFNISYTANINKVRNEIVARLNDRYFQQSAGVQLNLLSKKGWFLQNDLNNQYFSGLQQGFNQNFWLWNAGIGKKFLKDQRGELRLSVFDLLGQNQSIARNVTENYIEDVQNQVLQRYFLLTFTYNLRNFGAALSRGGGGNRPASRAN